MEPPDWPVPVRQLQGAALLEVGRAEEAEAAFNGDLKKFPENGWSLSGLQASLERQGKRRGCCRRSRPPRARVGWGRHCACSGASARRSGRSGGALTRNAKVRFQNG